MRLSAIVWAFSDWATRYATSYEAARALAGTVEYSLTTVFCLFSSCSLRWKKSIGSSIKLLCFVSKCLLSFTGFMLSSASTSSPLSATGVCPSAICFSGGGSGGWSWDPCYCCWLSCAETLFLVSHRSIFTASKPAAAVAKTTTRLFFFFFLFFFVRWCLTLSSAISDCLWTCMALCGDEVRGGVERELCLYVWMRRADMRLVDRFIVVVLV